MKWQTPDWVKRYSGNPVLSKKDVPYASELVFNAGITKFNNRYVMVFRNDHSCTQEEYAARTGRLQTNLGLAESTDGLTWQVHSQPLALPIPEGCDRVYDPRLSVIDGRCYMCYAADGKCGVIGGMAVTDDFQSFEVLFSGEPDNRNMVLFPEKYNGNFVRLDRPMPVYSRSGEERFDTWIAQSPDCRYWGMHRRILSALDIPYCNSKCGPGAPPIRTPKGWLTTFHSVWKLEENELYSWDPKGWNKIYLGGIMLLDLEDPSKVLGIAPQPLIAPETEYEKVGFRGEAIFPGGMLLEDSGEVKIYYGCSDTVECLVTADVNDLVRFCLEGR